MSSHSTSQSIVLPPELWDQIIDHLWDDQPSLSACGLTCRTWVRTARLHTFHSVSLHTAQDYTVLEEVLDSSQAGSSHGIAPYIHELLIFCKELDYSRDNVATFCNILPSLLRRLDAVEHLTLHCGGISSLTALDTIYESPLLPRLLSFDLGSMHFRSTGDIVRLFQKASRLTHFGLHSCSWSFPLALSSDIKEIPPSKSPVHLEELYIEDTLEHEDSVAGALLGLPLDIQFRKLVWKAHVVVRHRPLLRHFLQRGAPFLEHLSLIPNYLGLSCMPHELRELSLCTRLESLYIKSDCSNYKWISLAISCVASQCLKRVVVDMAPHMDSQGALHTFVSSRFCNWDVIDEHLVRLGRSSLQPTVLLQYICPVRPSEDVIRETMASLTDCLPWSKRDGLHFMVKFVGKRDRQVYAESSVQSSVIGKLQ